jgi:murein DD-endopeptidase MepM/ murein hydrolase activator NlpD
MRALAGAVAGLLAACVAAVEPAAPETPTPAPVEVVDDASAPPPPTSMSLACAGAFTQGGVALCRTMPGAEISVDGIARGVADSDGWAVIGFSREHGANTQVQARLNGESATQSYEVAPREFVIQRINGLPPQTVNPTDPAVLERIARESALKQTAFQSTADIEGFLDGFIRPVEGGVVTGTWGNQRVLNGEPHDPHFGYDIAVPTGTPIRAPAAGVVTLAQPDMHFEGGLVFIDHGQGLITMYLHMSRLDVREGDTVEQGQVIGAVGSSGRATGPHLCWRMKWRNAVQLDPSVAIAGLAQARRELLAGNGR